MKNILYSLVFVSLASAVFAQESAYEISNVKAINSNYLDYGATPFGDGLVFASTRNTNKKLYCLDEATNDHYADLYYTSKTATGSFTPPKPLEGDINERYHDGAATFFPNGKMMIFSRNDMRGRNAQQKVELKLYTATKQKDQWKDIKELSFNNSEYTSCHPTLSADGKHLYFASNRPGGYGGMDLYVTTFDGKKWSTPQNLGKGVNTPGNELFPHINNNTLYFASNGLNGEGGLDVFYTKVIENAWSKPVNMGQPINSSSDDFGFSVDKSGVEGFFSSNRSGGEGKDDIYTWIYKGLKPVIQEFIVQELGTDTPINKAKITIEPQDCAATNSPFVSNATATAADLSSDKEGSTSHEIIHACNYNLTINKEGYLPKTLSLKNGELTPDMPYYIKLEKRLTKFLLNGSVLSLADGNPIANASVVIKNKCTNKTTTISTNNRGKYSQQLDCDCDYEIVATKSGFEQEMTTLKKGITFNCANADSFASILRLATTPAPIVKTEVKKKVVAPTFEGTVLKEGAIIVLENIYYDYDKHFIRPDAAIELDKVVRIMQDYPSMTIELSSHTDARGSDAYNEQLSQRRATAAVEYLIKNGIASDRLIAKGYGEQILRNGCANGIKCSDDEHQVNRRTEIKVLAIDSNIQIEYNDKY